MKKVFCLLVFAATVFISACGGGGSSAPAVSTLGGTAAVGYPIVNGTVLVKCAGGSALSGTTSSAGAWQATISGQTLPCAVEVTGGTINGAANTTSYHSIATSWGTVNVTPLTDLMVANLAMQDPGAWFAGLTSTTLAPITATSVNNALTNVRTALSGLTPLNTIDPVTTTFTAAPGNTTDDMLTALHTAMTNSGVSYSTLQASASTGSFSGTAVISLNAALPTAYAGTTSGSVSTGGGTGSGIVGTWTGSITTPQQISYTVTFNSDGAFAKTSTMNIGGVAYSCSSTGTYTVSGNLVAIPYESGSCGTATFTESNGIRTVTSAVGTVSTSTVDSSLTISGTNLIANANSSLVFTRGGTTGGTTTTGAPTVTSFSPSTAPVGSSITITGTNFSTTPANNTVKFNGTSATVTASIATSLAVTVPSGATTGTVSVTTSGGTAASAGSFTVGAGGGGIPTAPSGVTATAGNNKLTISWSSVTGATSYNIYRSTTSGVTKSSTKIALNVIGASYSDTTAVNGITYYYAVTAVSSSGESALSNEVSAKPLATTTSVPTITSFTPTSGAVGTTVIITGTNFSTTPANNTVKFNGTTAAVTMATATSITVTVPSSATTGTVSVTTTGGVATSAGSFTVSTGGGGSSTPTVTGINPTSGAAGTSVTITGNNFSTTPASNTVKFNGTPATVTAAIATALTVTVPSGATNGTVSVTTAAGTATSVNSFTVSTGGGTGTDTSGGSMFTVRGSCSYNVGGKTRCSEYGGGAGAYLYPMSIPKDDCLTSSPVGTWSDGKCSTGGMVYKCYMDWGTLQNNTYYGASDSAQEDSCSLGTWTKL